MSVARFGTNIPIDGGPRLERGYVRYEPTPADQAGAMLLRALLDTLQEDRATGNAVAGACSYPSAVT